MSNDNAAPIELEFFAKAEHLSDVRRLIERLGGKSSLTRTQLDDLLTAVDEAAANAICHGSPKGERSLVKVICHPLTDGLVVEVRDTGPGFAALNGAPHMPAPDASGGRGLPLMCSLADSIEIASNSTGTTITLKKSARR